MINIEDLTIQFQENIAVENVSISIEDGEIVGIVGESGSGKSVTALTLMGLISEQAQLVSGKITFDDSVLLEAGKATYKKRIKSFQGSRMSMVFQEPMTSLNPTMKVGKQVEEVLELHTTMDKEEMHRRVVDIFNEVGLKDVEKIYDCYPHQLSGGMRQRVMIAMAIVLEPELLIADEPTTALDVTIQSQIIALLKEINKVHKNSMIFITHDLNLARNLASKIVVMQNGHVVETGATENIFTAPKEDYTKMLISVVPDRKKRHIACSAEVEGCGFKEQSFFDSKKSLEEVLRVTDLNVFYKDGNNQLFSKTKNDKQVVKNVDFSIYKGEVLGLVGESGCGKTSLSRAILGLNKNYKGEIKHFTERPKMIFQDPYSSLNPSKTIGWLLEEPLRAQNKLNKSDIVHMAHEMLNKVGLDDTYYSRKPSQLSGGQRQRISIGQALITKPNFVIADEPVSALDVTIQSQIMDLMMKLKEEMGLSYLFISHDINIVYQISDRIIVMKNGTIIETGETEQIFSEPKEQYTRILLA